MAKEIAGLIKLQIKGGAANPSPPVGPALGSKGVNIMQFCKLFNARTQDQPGKVLPVIITVYADKSFDFVVKNPPVAVQLIEALKIKKGSAEPHVNKVGSVTWDQVKEIAELGVETVKRRLRRAVEPGILHIGHYADDRTKAIVVVRRTGGHLAADRVTAGEVAAREAFADDDAARLVSPVGIGEVAPVAQRDLERLKIRGAYDDLGHRRESSLAPRLAFELERIIIVAAGRQRVRKSH